MEISTMKTSVLYGIEISNFLKIVKKNSVWSTKWKKAEKFLWNAIFRWNFMKKNHMEFCIRKS